MLDTYLFIPAQRHDFIEKIPSLSSDFYIVDFEESVSQAQKFESIQTFPRIAITNNMYARPYFPLTEIGTLDTHFFEELLSLGFTKFVIPKIETLLELQQISNVCTHFLDTISCILLIESPRCLLNLEHILDNSDINIEAIALGSHDFAHTMRMEHTIENLQFARNQVLCIARAYNIACIDIVSMDISASPSYIEECKKAVSMGYDGKFMIHPKQIAALNTIELYSHSQIKEALEVYNAYLQQGESEFSVVSLHGRVYEKPHLQRIKKIIDWSKTKR